MFIDSNVLIAYVKEKDLFQKDSEILLCEIQNGKISAKASSISLMELAYVLKKYKKSNKEINTAIHAVLSINNLEFLPITSDLLREAADFIELYSLSLSDAIIVATLTRLNIREIVSEDSDFDSLPFLKRISMKDAITEI